jgi:hypothetical protein
VEEGGDEDDRGAGGFVVPEASAFVFVEEGPPGFATEALDATVADKGASFVVT